MKEENRVPNWAGVFWHTGTIAGVYKLRCLKFSIFSEHLDEFICVHPQRAVGQLITACTLRRSTGALNGNNCELILGFPHLLN